MPGWYLHIVCLRIHSKHTTTTVKRSILRGLHTRRQVLTLANCGRGWTGLTCPFPDNKCLKTWPQVRLDFSDLRARLDWALAHDQEAHLMADAARRVAHRRLRYQDIQVRTNV